MHLACLALSLGPSYSISTLASYTKSTWWIHYMTFQTFRSDFSEFLAGKGNSGKEKEILKRNSEKKFWQGGGPGVGD
jgi:hypothetical protein